MEAGVLCVIHASASSPSVLIRQGSSVWARWTAFGGFVVRWCDEAFENENGFFKQLVCVDGGLVYAEVPDFP